jgi:raffinose/stachyose/melibiose transport system permease protein
MNWPVRLSSRFRARQFKRNRLFLPTWQNYLYIVPIFLFIGGLIYFPIVYTFNTSTLDWNGLSRNSTFIGLDNFKDLASDTVFFQALKNTVIYTVLSIAGMLSLGLFVAVMLNTNVRLKAVYKVIFFMPVVTSPVIVAYVFRHILDPTFGELTTLSKATGLSFLSHGWLSDQNTALYALVIITIWEFMGFSFMMYFAALTMLDKHLYEAALIDGASFLQMNWFITVPLLRTTHFSLITLSIINLLKNFDLIWLTTGGGPGHATEFLGTYIFKKAILEYNTGYSAAISVVLLAISLVITALQWKFYYKREAA